MSYIDPECVSITIWTCFCDSISHCNAACGVFWINISEASPEVALCGCRTFRDLAHVQNAVCMKTCDKDVACKQNKSLYKTDKQ